MDKKKKKIVLWTVGIALFLLVVLVVVLFLTNNGDDEVLPVPEDEVSQGWTIWNYVNVLALVVLVVFCIWVIKKDKIVFNLGDVIRPVDPDKAVELFQRNIALKNSMNACFDKDDKIRFINGDDFREYMRRPFVKHDEKFLFLEFELVSGSHRGVHCTIIPLSVGEEAIVNGTFRIDYHTPFNLFKMQSRTYPLVSPRDRQLRVLSALADDETELDAEKMKLLEQFGSVGARDRAQKPVESGSGQMSRMDFEDLKSEGEINPWEEYNDFVGDVPKKYRRKQRRVQQSWN